MKEQLISGRPEGNSTYRGQRLGAWRWILLLVAAAMSLGCMTTEIGFKVTHQEGQDDQVTFKIAQHLTDKYIEAARKANKERRQDYEAAGLAMPKDLPDTMQGFRGLTSLLVLDPKDLAGDFKVVEDPRGFIATANYTLAEWLRKQAESGPDMLQVDRDDPEVIRYIFQIDFPSRPDNIDPDKFYRERQKGLRPKPGIEIVDPDKIQEEHGLIAGLAASAVRTLGLEGTALDGWYLERIFFEAGTPEFRLVVELPGKIVAHKVDDQTTGVVEGNRVTLFMDEAFIRQLGSGEHRLRVESVLNVCEDHCAQFPHQIWSGEKTGPKPEDCKCICEKGWQMVTAEGCTACEEVCRQWDSRAEYDSANSEPNKCACQCRGQLLRFEWEGEKGKCECVPGAVPKGDECRCPDGLTPSVSGDRCVKEEKEEEPPKKKGCQEGQTCLSHPAECACDQNEICDPFSEYRDPKTFCSPKVAYIFISSSLSNRETWWLLPKIINIRVYYWALGYRTLEITVNGLNDIADKLSNPSTKAIAYFGHAVYPSLESADVPGIRNALYLRLLQKYLNLGVEQNRAFDLANERSNHPNLDYAYIHTCGSLGDDTTYDFSLQDYLLRSGGIGIYWGYRGPVSALHLLEKSTKP